MTNLNSIGCSAYALQETLIVTGVEEVTFSVSETCKSRMNRYKYMQREGSRRYAREYYLRLLRNDGLIGDLLQFCCLLGGGLIGLLLGKGILAFRTKIGDAVIS